MKSPFATEVTHSGFEDNVQQGKPSSIVSLQRGLLKIQ